MRSVKAIAMMLIVLAAVAAAFLWYMGMFSSLKAYEAKMGPFTIAYEKFVGPYSKTGAVFTKVYNELSAEGVSTVRGLGIYYDDPSKVSAEALRSDCGSIIEVQNMAAFSKVSKKFLSKTITKSNSVVVEFPIKNALSYMFGPIKAYPALMRYASEKSLKPTMTYEIYDESKGKTFFVMVVGK